MNTFAAMKLRRLKIQISWFFLMVLAVGMADFSLHALTHEHAQSHQSHHSVCEHGSEIESGSQTIFTAEQECLRCEQFLVHTAWAVSDLVAVQIPDFSKSVTLISDFPLILNKWLTAFLRGPPEP